jgi:hypothetical protein
MRLRSSIAVTLSWTPLGEAGLAAPQPQAHGGEMVLWLPWGSPTPGTQSPAHEKGSAASVMLPRQTLGVKGFASPGPLWPG